MVTLIKEIVEVLHRIRVKLYPSYLPRALGKFLARTANEAVLTVNDICAALKNRGGFDGSFEDLVNNVNLFIDEMIYQLCDGFAVSNKYFSIHTRIGGSFISANETFNRKKNPIIFKFCVRPKLKRLVDEIDVFIEGLADVNGWIDEFTDTELGETNSIFSPGNMCELTGSKIKIEGNDPGVGLYIVAVSNPAVKVKVARIAENSPSRIIFIVPQTGYAQNTIEITTQHAPGGTLLKTPRVITSTFTIEEV